MDYLMDKGEYTSGIASCPFCLKQTRMKAVGVCGTVYAVRDANPVTDGHTLVVTKRHVADFFEMTAEEQRDTNVLLARLREDLLGGDRSIAGFNVGINCGRAAGQTVMHVHVHLIPRRNGDTPKPCGGVRGVIPEKMSY